MQNHKRMCKLLLEGDSYFNDENVDTEKINKDITIKGYCRNGSCKTNEESISALTAYIFMEFKRSIVIKKKYNHYDECLLMWVSDKLYKMHLKSIGKKNVKDYIDGTTLNQAYEKYLEKHKGILDYWTLFNIIGDLKEANLKYMSEFYKLLNLICKLITGYYNGSQTKQFYKYPADCSFQYKTLYLNISECKPYLNLLNKLKGIYDDFRNYTIKNNSANSKLATKLKKLTPKDKEEMDAVRGFKTYNFSGSQCKLPKKKKTNPKKPDKTSLQSSNQLKGGQQETPPPHKPEIKETKQQSSTESAPQSPQVPASNIQKDSPGSQGISGGASDKLPTHGVKSQNSDDGQPDPPGNSGTPKNQTNIPSVQDKPQETNPTTPENTGKENAQRSDIADTSNKDHKLKGSEPISQHKQDPQPSEDKGPPIESGSELKDEVKELDNTQTDTDTQGGSNPEHENKQDETDTPKDTDTGTGNPGSVPDGGQDGKIGDSGSGGGGSGLGTGGEPASIQNDKGSSGGGTRGTSNVPDDQIPNGTQGGADTSQQGTNDQGTTSHQGGDTSGGANPQEKSPDSQKETQPSSSDPQKVSTSSPKPQQTPTPLPATPQVEKQDSPSPPKLPEQSKDDKEKAPQTPVKESSQLKLPNLAPSQEPKLGGDKNTPDISPKGQSSEQKDSGGGTGNQNPLQGDLKTHDHTPVTNKGGSDDGSGGGSDDSNRGTGDKDKVPSNTGDGQNDKDGSDSKQGSQGEPGGGPGSGLGSESGSGLRSESGSGSGSEQGIQGGPEGSDNGQGVKDSETGGSGSGGGGNGGSGEQGSNSGGSSDQGSSGGDKGGSDGNKGSQDGSGGTGSGSPAPDDPSPPQTSQSSQTLQNPQGPQSPQILQTPQIQPTPQTSLLSSSKEQAQEQKPSPGTSGSQNSDRIDQGDQKPVIKQDNAGTKVKGNEITGIGDSCVLKGYKQFVISIIVILIPITLTILYKYLSSGWQKETKRKKNMTKVINMVGVNKTTKTVIKSTNGKKQIKIIIKSSSKKKQAKKSINSDYGEKSPSLNIYKLMQADPVPFI
ncbi:CIR protein, partial [Plasmodium chabaudi adami]